MIYREKKLGITVTRKKLGPKPAPGYGWSKGMKPKPKAKPKAKPIKRKRITKQRAPSKRIY